MEFSRALLETLVMVFASGLIAVCGGLPLGVLLFITKPKQIQAKPWLYHSLGFIVNTGRSIPFIIFLIALIPFTRLVVGTSIGTMAAVVPLSIAAIPFFARLVEAALLGVDANIITAMQAMGASPWQIVRQGLLPEALPAIIQAITNTLVNLVGYGAMAGTVGGGGLGDLAIRYGYQRFETDTMLITVAVLVIIVQGIQSSGDHLSRHLDRT